MTVTAVCVVIQRREEPCHTARTCRSQRATSCLPKLFVSIFIEDDDDDDDDDDDEDDDGSDDD